MLLIISDKVKEDLALLQSLPTEVVCEFCRISFEFLKKGVNGKVYQSAAQKLGVEPIAVQKAVEGLMYILLESSKQMLSNLDFQDSLKAIGLSEEVQQEMLQQYSENVSTFRMLQKEMSMDLPHYSNLEWRLDVQVASRCLRNQVEPVITLKLHTEDGSQHKVTVLEADPSNLIHMARTLDEALQELNTPHCRRIMRNL